MRQMGSGMARAEFQVLSWLEIASPVRATDASFLPTSPDPFWES